jgi:hypothetical protein
MTPEEYDSSLRYFITETQLKRPEILDYVKHPILHEDGLDQPFDTHYIYHVAWALRILAKTRPSHHLDISSSLYFNIAASAMTEVTLAEIRPTNLYLDNLSIIRRDIQTPSDWDTTRSDSVSCMHVLEHIGLGRYGDKLDPMGDLKGISLLKSIVNDKGQLLFVVPVGRPALHFNAHRIYRAQDIADLFAPEFMLESYTLIPGPADMPPLEDCPLGISDNLPYGCGCFFFKKSA